MFRPEGKQREEIQTWVRGQDKYKKEGRKEMFYLTTHSTHFIYGYMASDICKRATQIDREETCCRHMDYSFRLPARVLLYASFMMIHTTAFVTPVVEHWLEREIAQWVHPMKDRSVDPSHHERTLLLLSYISLPDKYKRNAYFCTMYLFGVIVQNANGIYLHINKKSC